MKFLRNFFHIKKKDIKLIDIWFIVFIFNILINPFNLLNIGFIFSYGITLILIISSNFFQPNIDSSKSLKTKYIRSFKNTLFLTFLLFPITINLNNTLNLFLPLEIYIYEIIILLMIILSFSYLGFFIFPLIQNFIIYYYQIIVNIFEKMNEICLIGIIHIHHLNVLIALIYYYYLVKVLEEYQYFQTIQLKYYIYGLVIFFVLFLNINVLGQVDIIDIGQGDAILLQEPLNQDTILIDTGPSNSSEELIDFLNYSGVETIDYLILTHNHADHTGGVYEVLSEKKVKNIIINERYYNKYFEEINDLLKLLKQCGYYVPNIVLVKDEVQLDKKIIIYAPNSYSDNQNNNSLIVYYKDRFTSWLFMGDAEKEIEKEFIENYPVDVDNVKLGHHGSKTSTTDEFLNITTPQKVYISSGKNNMYGHPSSETLEKLEKRGIKYYDTQTDGEIKRLFF